MRIRDGDGGGAHLVFAYYITGHATRALEPRRSSCSPLRPPLPGSTSARSSRSCSTAAPGSPTPSPSTAWPRSRSILKSEAEWLKSINADLVVSDVPVAWSAPDMNGGAESSSRGLADTMLPLKSLSGLVGNGLRSPVKQTRERAAASFSLTGRSAADMNASAELSSQGLADTMPPLKSLSGLVRNGLKSPEKQTRERAAASLLSDWEVVRTRERTPSTPPPSKRRRGRSLPPASTPADGSYLGLRPRSSSPPSPERTRSKDKTMATAKAVFSPTAVFWDVENCRVPKDAQVEHVSENIREALSLNPAVDSVPIKAYGAPNRIREGLQRTGVTLVNIPNRRKDAADKLILVDMLLFAQDNPTTASIFLISGDGDFALAVRGLVQRGYTIVIAIPSVDTAASALGSYMWDWPSLARGEGIVIPRSLPDDFEVLTAQMVQLFQSNGGYIELHRVLPEYKKLFGKKIRLANYGAPKLIDLFMKMGNPFFVVERKMVFLNMQPALEESTIGANQQHENQASTSVTSEVPASVADDLFVNTEDDHYAPMEDKVVEAVIAGASSHEDEPNEPCINNVFIGKNLKKEEPEKVFKDCLLKK